MLVVTVEHHKTLAVDFCLPVAARARKNSAIVCTRLRARCSRCDDRRNCQPPARHADSLARHRNILPCDKLHAATNDTLRLLVARLRRVDERGVAEDVRGRAVEIDAIPAVSG